MSAIDGLIAQIEDKTLRERLKCDRQHKSDPLAV